MKFNGSDDDPVGGGDFVPLGVVFHPHKKNTEKKNTATKNTRNRTDSDNLMVYIH